MVDMGFVEFDANGFFCLLKVGAKALWGSEPPSTPAAFRHSREKLLEHCVLQAE